MKTILVAALALVPCWVMADAPAISTAPNTAGPQPTEELKVMTERIGLSQDQQDKIAPLLVSEAKEWKTIQGDKSLSPQEKQVHYGEVHRATVRQIRTYFTPSQMALIEQGQDHPAAGPSHP